LLDLWLFATVEGVAGAGQVARICGEHIAYRGQCGGVCNDKQEVKASWQNLGISIVSVLFLASTDLSPTETGRAPALLQWILLVILCRLILRRRGFFVSEFVNVFLAHLEITQCQANFILLSIFAPYGGGHSNSCAGFVICGHPIIAVGAWSADSVAIRATLPGDSHHRRLIDDLPCWIGAQPRIMGQRRRHCPNGGGAAQLRPP
jgi:hypothetical protein